MFDQSRIVAELLRLMIAGEHPVDLKLMRLCAGKIHCEARVDPAEMAVPHMVGTIEMLDEAQLFDAPPHLVRALRADALRALDETGV